MTYRLDVTFDILDVPATRTSRILCWFFDHILVQPLLVKHAVVYDLQAHDFRTLFEYIHRGRRHRPRQYATDISMVSSGGSEEYDLVGPFVKNWSDDSDVR